MRIAIVNELFHPHVGGTEKRLLEIGRRLVKRGHEVHVFTTQYSKELRKEEVVDGIWIHRYGYSGNYVNPSHYRSLTGILRYSLGTASKLLVNHDFDIYYFGQWPILHSILSRPFVHPLVQEWCEVWLKKIASLQRLQAKMADHHVAVSSFTKKRMVERLGADPRKITVIPNGVDYGRFSQGSRDKRWGSLVYVGRLVPHKNVDIVLESYRLVKEVAPEAELHIVGDGPLLPTIKRWASQLRDCYVHGFLPEDLMADVLKRSWLFVSASGREGYGMAALEAMAAGTPVVTVDAPDNAIKDIPSGGILVVPMKAKKASLALAMSSAIRRLLSNETEWREMSESARLYASKLDWDIIAHRVEECFQRSVNIRC
jgi:glycosyltransferase involved in cell wall biosynthesis